MRRSAESPNLAPTATLAEDRAADRAADPAAKSGLDEGGGGDGGMASCENLTVSPEHQAVEVANATGAVLVAEPPTPPKRRWVSLLGLTAGVLALGGMSAAFIFFPINWEAIGSWGYVGVFGVVLTATASVALPIPYLLIVARAGSYLDPFVVALVAGVAGTLGELAGYVIGIGGSGLIPHGRWYERAWGWICSAGFWCIAVLACVPNPFFDAIGVAAGTLRYSWWRFSLACMLGNAIKFLVAALIGTAIAAHGWLD
jgi:membrane protein YqaA with SNARE-associated domain